MKHLVVTEKPSVASDIVNVLKDNFSKKQGYYEGDNYIVTYAFGHLCDLATPGQIDKEKYGKWDMAHLPYPFSIKSHLKILPKTKSQFNVIKSLINRSDVDYIINAGDAGREGILIQEWIYRLAGNKKPVKLLWASSLTAEALNKHFKSLKGMSGEFVNLFNEAECRAILDWKYGMNYTAALTLKYNTLLRYGRCKTPLLKLIVDRDIEIENFKSVPYYKINAISDKNGFYLTYESDFDNKDSASDFISKLEKSAKITEYNKEEKETYAPTLFSLTDLQIHCGKKFKFSADKTLEIAQRLYETYKISSYPRTDSNYMTTDLFNEIESHVSPVLEIYGIKNIDVSNVNVKKYVNDGKVTDHTALMPTGNPDTAQIYQTLSEDEKKVFDEICKRVLAIFMPPYKFYSVSVKADISGNTFIAKGTSPISPGFKVLYGKDTEGEDTEKEGSRDGKETVQEQAQIPDLAVGDIINITNFDLLEKMTSAPASYTVSSIISLMKKYKIGTPATMASIIAGLTQKDKQGDSLLVLSKNKYKSTQKARDYINILPDEMKNVDLLASIEDRLSDVGAGKKSYDSFISDLDNEVLEKLSLIKNLNDVKITSKEKTMSNELEGLKCPKCGGELATGEYGVYCKNKCGMSFRYYKEQFSPEQIKKILAGEKIPMKGISKDGNKYDYFLQSKGISENVYNGKTYYNFDFEKSFPDKK